MLRYLVASICAVLALASQSFAIPCFPGAEGFGTDTPGGRGGRVISVTTLEDAGPGSLRAACEAKGPRMVVFKVGGAIRLKSPLIISEPFITIAGQSAPGNGILIRDKFVQVTAHDVVIRFVRMRIGASLIGEFKEQNCLEVSGKDAYNVVIDHCSFSWSTDENVGIVSGAHDSTFSYNIASEALSQPFTETRIGEKREHSMCLILGNDPNHISVHHNLLSNCTFRNPRIQGGTHDFVNNIVYGWGYYGAQFSRDPNVNFIGNYYKAGPASRKGKILTNDKAIGRIYTKGNVVPDGDAADASQWTSLTDNDASHQATEPFPTAPLKITDARAAYSDVLASAGCQLPKQDEVDARVIRQVRLTQGTVIDRPEEVGGWPDMPVAFAAPDSDSDGMPDSYEIKHGLNPRDASDGIRLSRGGYTNLEVYLNSIVEDWMSEAPKVVTYPIPDAVTDSPYAVTVNGVSVPIELGGTIEGAYYARFQFTGTVAAKVSVKGEAVEIESVKPERYVQGLTREGAGVSMEVAVAGPRVVMAKAGGKQLRPLILIADDYEPNQCPDGARVIDIAGYVTGDGVQTAAIQRALDDCAARPDGGVVYFGPGVYRTGTIRIKDNTTVYLAPGALIQASENAADFPVDPGRKEEGSHGPVCSFSRLIMFDHCKNSSLRGYGVIDGMGHIVRNVHHKHVQLCDVTDSRNIHIENVVFRNSAEWTLHILGCENVWVDNLKIINDYKVGNTDGIDPDCSRNVYIRRYFGYCGDDAVAIKTTGNSDLLRPARNIEVRDSVVMTRKTAYKIGTETYADIDDVLFQDCEAINSSRGIGIWLEDGSTITHLIYRDMNLDLHEIQGEGWSGEPMRAVIIDRNGIGKLRDILFDRVISAAPYRSVFSGLPESKIEGANFWGCRFIVRPREDKMGVKPVIELENVKDFAFKYAYLDWLTNDPANWAGFTEQQDCENVLVREIEETRP